MKNVYIYCEGQTEEAFINEVLSPYFLNQGIWVSPIICSTKRTAYKKYRGGVNSYDKIKKELRMLCTSHKNEFVTTMFDYYGMPENTPGIGYNAADIYERMKQIESNIDSDIGMPNCRFHFMLHEFEAILFSKPEAFGIVAENDVVKGIQKVRKEFPSPEHINNTPETAPSKRIKALLPTYSKIGDGILVAKETGIDAIMKECPHFRNWIQYICNLK